MSCATIAGAASLERFAGGAECADRTDAAFDRVVRTEGPATVDVEVGETASAGGAGETLDSDGIVLPTASVAECRDEEGFRFGTVPAGVVVDFDLVLRGGVGDRSGAGEDEVLRRFFRSVKGEEPFDRRRPVEEDGDVSHGLPLR